MPLARLISIALFLLLTGPVGGCSDTVRPQPDDSVAGDTPEPTPDIIDNPISGGSPWYFADGTDDLDFDGDGLVDALDPCVSDPHNDVDEDGLCAPFDGCPDHWDPQQLDGDNDGVGDACDACPSDANNDMDHDQICAGPDLCPGIYNPWQTDIDGDGVGDECDICPRGGDGFPGCDGDASGVPVVTQVGSPVRYLLTGMVVTPYIAFVGQVLVVGDTLECVAPDCSDEPLADGATVINTNGIIYPGMLDSHNHVLYNVFNNDDWVPAKWYENHNQWPNEDAYNEMQDTYNYLVTKADANLKCEVLKYGEIKALLGGTTSVLGAAKGSPQKCYKSLARSIDGSFNDLPDAIAPPGVDPLACTAGPSHDHIQVSSLGVPSASTAEGVLNNLDSCKTWSYVIHVAEGVPTNASAFNEWDDLLEAGLDQPETAIVHGTALGLPEFQHMVDVGMKLVWSPRSNYALYGFTTRIDQAMQTEGELTIALAPDWSMGGSSSLLHELDFAREWADENWNGLPDSRHLVEMVTINAARALAVDGHLGSLEPGKLADLFVVSGNPGQPWQALVDAGPGDVRLVMVGGVILVADEALEPALSLQDCELMDVCGQSRFLCVAEPDTTDGVDQTFGEIQGLLNDALDTYDAANGTIFSPVAPPFVCAE
ncbi:MAG: 5-methylthioadenosine/S-adenosylhomocysteine deaminase [Myxococcota bacterium]